MKYLSQLYYINFILYFHIRIAFLSFIATCMAFPENRNASLSVKGQTFICILHLIPQRTATFHISFYELRTWMHIFDRSALRVTYCDDEPEWDNLSSVRLSVRVHSSVTKWNVRGNALRKPAFLHLSRFASAQIFEHFPVRMARIPFPQAIIFMYCM